MHSSNSILNNVKQVNSETQRLSLMKAYSQEKALGLSKEQTDKVSVSFEVYPMYIFEGIKEPIIRNEKICGCYGYDMKISEDKIDKALSCIKDTEMRLKIQHILKSFHKRY